MKQHGSAGLCREQAEGRRGAGQGGRPQKLHSVCSLEAWLLAFLPSSWLQIIKIQGCMQICPRLSSVV